MAYTLRLDDKQRKKLHKIMKWLKVGSANKAFVEMVMRFEADQNELETLRKKTRDQQNQLHELKRLFQERERLNQEISTRLNSD